MEEKAKQEYIKIVQNYLGVAGSRLPGIFHFCHVKKCRSAKYMCDVDWEVTILWDLHNILVSRVNLLLWLYVSHFKNSNTNKSLRN